jgi:glycosyltransferase involved in cell wall biosynthesis
MKNIIFIGGLFPKEIKKDIEKKTKGTIDNAADTLQRAIITGLDFYTKLRLINLPFIKVFPFYQRIKMKSFDFSHYGNSQDVNVGFINLPFVRKISRYLNTKSKLKSFIEYKDEIILIYSLHVPFIKAAIELKNKYPLIKVCVIVPDLFQFASEESRWKILRYINNKEKHILEKSLQMVDAFVVLSDFMYSPLQIGNRPWVRVEGIFNDKESTVVEEKEAFKTILYSGTLAKRYGILNLLDAFLDIKDENYRLWICGDGDAIDEINNRKKVDKRIIYFGQIPREEVLILQKRATVLVNPRTSFFEYTKYSFPSKIMEYLGSGTPCLIHRLPGIPAEYFKYVFVAEEQTAEGLKKSIIEICNLNSEKLIEIGQRAKSFVTNYKTPIKQCEKIFSMVSRF